MAGVKNLGLKRSKNIKNVSVASLGNAHIKTHNVEYGHKTMTSELRN